MNTGDFRILPMLLLVSCSFASSAAAQEFPGGATSVPEPFAGSGTAQIKRLADRMVTWIPLQASGSDVRAATTALQQKIAAAKVQLKELGAQEESLKAGEIALTNNASDVRERMMRIQQGLMRGRNQSPQVDESESETAVVTVTTSLRADWALIATDGPELLAAASELQAAVRNAKLTEDSSEQQLPPEQQELFEEARMFADSGEADTSREPVFVFLAKVTPQERAALLKQAFQRAEAEARELAEATGTTLGSIGTVRQSSPSGTSAMGSRYGTSYYPLLSQYGSSEQSQAFITELLQELSQSGPVMHMIGAAPGELTYAVSVTAGFNRP